MGLWRSADVIWAETKGCIPIIFGSFGCTQQFCILTRIAFVHACLWGESFGFGSLLMGRQCQDSGRALLCFQLGFDSTAMTSFTISR